MIQQVKTESRQRGAVLPIALIILLVVTIISMQGTESTLLQEKMTSAVRDSHIALEVAQSGLADAEAYIETLVSTVDFKVNGTVDPTTNLGGLYVEGSAPIDIFASGVVWRPAVTSVDGITPKYFIEELGIIDEEDNVNLQTAYGQTSGQGDVTGFRVVSRGEGKNTNTVRVVIAYYGKRL